MTLDVGRKQKMTKRRQTIKIRLPLYEGNRLAWRRAIHQELRTASAGVIITKTDQIELIVTLYFNKSSVHWHDVDNRLKDIMDALQGRLGGPKSVRPIHPIVSNDNQVFRVQIEKCIAPKQSHGKGHLIVKKYVRRTRNAQPGVVADGSGLSRAVRGTARAIPARG